MFKKSLSALAAGAITATSLFALSVPANATPVVIPEGTQGVIQPHLEAPLMLLCNSKQNAADFIDAMPYYTAVYGPSGPLESDNTDNSQYAANYATASYVRDNSGCLLAPGQDSKDSAAGLEDKTASSNFPSGTKYLAWLTVGNLLGDIPDACASSSPVGFTYPYANQTVNTVGTPTTTVIGCAPSYYPSVAGARYVVGSTVPVEAKANYVASTSTITVGTRFNTPPGYTSAYSDFEAQNFQFRTSASSHDVVSETKIGKPNKVRNLKVNAASKNVKVSWKIPSFVQRTKVNGHSTTTTTTKPVGYKFRITNSKGKKFGKWRTTKKTSVIFKNRKPGKYRLQVRAYNRAGSSGISTKRFTVHKRPHIRTAVRGHMEVHRTYVNIDISHREPLKVYSTWYERDGFKETSYMYEPGTYQLERSRFSRLKITSPAYRGSLVYKIPAPIKKRAS